MLAGSGVVPAAQAAEAGHVAVLPLAGRVRHQNLRQLLLRNLFFLAVGGLVAFCAAAMAVDLLLSRPAHRHLVQLRVRNDPTVAPVLLGWEVGEGGQLQVLRIRHALDVDGGTGRTEWAKAQEVIATEGFLFVAREDALVEELTLKAGFAEPPFVIGTGLLLLGLAYSALFGLWVAVHTLLFLVAVSILLHPPTDWNLVFNVGVQKVAFVSPETPVFYPVDADQLLALALVHVVVEGLSHCLHHVNRRNVGGATVLSKFHY